MKRLLLLLVAASMLVIVGCKKEDTNVTLPTEQESLFSQDTSTAVAAALKPMPTSLNGTQVAAAGLNGASNPALAGGMEGIFVGVTMYVQFADMVKEMAKNMVTQLLVNPYLAVLEQGVYHPLTPESVGDPVGVQIDYGLGTYDWTVSIFFTDQASGPEMIFHLTQVDTAVKGQIKMQMTEDAEQLVPLGYNVPVPRTMEVTFDSSVTPNTMEIRLISDLSALHTFAQAQWPLATQALKDAIDLGQPQNVFLNATENNGTYTLSGTSYHPGWEWQATLDGTPMFFGPGRTMYSFKAHAVEGSGAQLFLALPDQNRADITGMWTDSAVGELYTQAMVAQINGDLATQIGGTLANQQNAFWTINFLVPNNMPFPVGTSITALQYTNFQAFWAGTTIETDLAAMGILDDITAGAYLTGGALPLDKRNVYYLLTAPDVNAQYAAAPTLTAPILTDFINNFVAAPASPEEAFISTYNTIRALVNPALFNDVSGFLGTFNGLTNTYYQYDALLGSLTEQPDTSAIDALLLYDLSGIDPYTPVEVVNATITMD